MDDRGISVNQARIALQYLNDQVNGQTDEVKIIEESLALCQTRVKELRLELTRVQSELSTGGISRPATDRLKKALSKIEIELDNEMLNEEQFKSVLTQEQLKLEKAIIEKSKLVEIDLEIKSHEDSIKEFKDCHAAQRVELEASNARNSIATMEREIDEIEQRNEASIERAERQMAEGLKARQETLPLIAKTAQNLHKMREAEEAHLASVYNRRQEGVETLRTELKVNREELVAIHQRKLAAEAREAERERNLPPVVKEKTQMTEGQAKREAYIRAQLDQRRKEEAHDRARLPQQKTENEKAREQSAEDKRKMAKLNQRRMTYFDGNLMAAIMDMDLNENIAARDPYQLVKTKTKAKKWRKRTSTFNRDRFKDRELIEGANPDLLIDGESGETPKMKKKTQTKAEILAKKKERHREELERKRRQNAKNRINAQLASKAVVKSVDFVATPSKIIFADYLPSKRYVVKIDLTNVSHQISSIRYHSLSDNLKQICEAMFTPAGALSPGMSTTFRLGFISDDNTDEVNGTVKFETPSGFVDIPVLARPPKVEPRLSVTAIDFATQQTGEEVAKVIQLENAGALRGTFDMRIELEPECTQTDMLYELSLSPTEGGQLEAHTTVEIMLSFKPKVTGHLKAQLIINVENGEKRIHSYRIPLSGTTIDLPISVSESEFDMSVCTIGFLYQDQFTISNSAKTVRVITFHVPPEAGQMLQVFPKTGYVQAEASLTAQIKFQPDEKVLESEACLEYYDPDTGVIEFPVTLTVANQAQPIHIYVYGIITGFNLEVSDKKVNFGPCTTTESVWRTITISNNTMLPQDFGFLDLPTYVTVRPGSGFGTILPNEELNIELIFSAPEAGEFAFDIVLQTVRGFKFTIECGAIGVKPALTLSHQHLSFATPLHDTHRLSFYLTNSHTHSDEFKYSVARIGKENVFPVGPTSFCFMFPDDCGFTFSPAVGTILPGEYKFITVMFTPQLGGTDIGNQVKKLELETKMLDDDSGGGQASGGGLGRKESVAKLDRKKSSVGIRRKKSEALISIAGKSKAVNKNSKFFWQARDYLTRIYQSNEDIYQIPCFIAPGTISMSKTTSLEYRHENCIWIEVKANRKRPDIVVKSSGGPDYNPDGDGSEKASSEAGGEKEAEKKEPVAEAYSRPVLQLQAKDSKEENIGKTSLDFESQPVGTTVKKTIIIENISDHEVEMTSSLLDPHGPFTMLNPLCELEPGETHAILLNFSPGADKIYHEVMHIYHPTGEGGQDACLNISLRGVGMMPSCSLTAPNATQEGVLPFAPICPGELAEQTLHLRNTSRFPIQFRMYMDSQNPSQILLNPNRPEVFSCDPPTGMLEIGDECEVTVRFSPTETCLGSFSDNLVLRLFGDMKKYGELKLMGNVYQHPLFMHGVQTTGYTPKAAESGISVSSRKSSQLSPIQAETVVLEMIEKLIDANGDVDDEDDEDNTYFEGTFTVNATIMSNKVEPLDDGGKAKPKDKKAKSDGNKGGAGNKTLSFKIAPLVDGLNLEEVGIELEGTEGEIEWGETKKVKVKASTLDEPFVGLKVTLNSTLATYCHQLVLKPCSFIHNII